MKKHVLFDLDGTLTDSAGGVVNGVCYALDKMGDFDSDRTRLKTFVGPPLSASFANLGYSNEKVELAIGYFREYYNPTGIFENDVYDGVFELLETLARMERTLILATCKPRPSAEQVLDMFKLKSYFSFVSASEFDGTRAFKDEVIAYVLETCEIDRAQAVMIGDHRHDILGAKKYGLTSVGCVYGYGGRTDLEAAGADYLVNSVGELLKLFTDGAL